MRASNKDSYPIVRTQNFRLKVFMKYLFLFSCIFSSFTNGMLLPPAFYIKKSHEILDYTLELKKGLPLINCYSRNLIDCWKKYKKNNQDVEDFKKLLSSDHIHKCSMKVGSSIDSEPEARFCFAFARAVEVLAMLQVRDIALVPEDVKYKIYFKEARTLIGILEGIAETKIPIAKC